MSYNLYFLACLPRVCDLPDGKQIIKLNNIFKKNIKTKFIESNYFVVFFLIIKKDYIKL